MRCVLPALLGFALALAARTRANQQRSRHKKPCLLDLPDVLVHLTCQFLEPADRHRLACTSQQLRHMALHPSSACPIMLCANSVRALAFLPRHGIQHVSVRGPPTLVDRLEVPIESLWLTLRRDDESHDPGQRTVARALQRLASHADQAHALRRLAVANPYVDHSDVDYLSLHFPNLEALLLSTSERSEDEWCARWHQDDAWWLPPPEAHLLHVSAPSLALLQRLPHLRRLVLDTLPLDDATVELLCSLPHVTDLGLSLSVQHVRLDRGWERLHELPLCALRLWDPAPNLFSSLMAPNGRLRTLELLNTYRAPWPMPLAWAVNGGCLRHLERLVLRDFPLPSALGDWAASLPKLCELEADLGDAASTASLRQLACSPLAVQLTHVCVHRPRQADAASLGQMTGLQRLRLLDLGWSEWDDKSLIDTISCLRRLRQLQVRFVQDGRPIQKAAVRALLALPDLRLFDANASLSAAARQRLTDRLICIRVRPQGESSARGTPLVSGHARLCLALGMAVGGLIRANASRHRFAHNRQVLTWMDTVSSLCVQVCACAFGVWSAKNLSGFHIHTSM